MNFRYDSSALQETATFARPSPSSVADAPQARRWEGPRAESGVSISNVFRTLRRHWIKSLVFFVAASGLVVAALVLAPRKYSSEAKLFVRIGRETVGLDPTATTGETMSLQRENEVEMNSIMELLGSRNLMEVVVDTLGPERILADPAVGGAAADRGVWQLVRQGTNAVKSVLGTGIEWVRQLDPISDRDEAIHTLQKSVELTIPKRSSVVSVSFHAKSPQLAHDVVECLVTAYLDEHRRINRTEGSYEFFRDQSEKSRAELAQATQELSDAKNEIGVLSIAMQKTLLHEQQLKTETERATAQAELAAVESQIASLSEMMEQVSPRIAADMTTGHDNLAADKMREQLYDLEVRKAELLSQYQPNHPLVVAIEEQLREARKIFQEQPDARARSTQAVNPTYQRLEVDLFTARGRAAALRSQSASLGEQLVALSAQKAELNESEVRLGHMERRIEVLASDYRGQLAKLEQSRINEALAQQRISNVNIAQPATLVAKPVSPNKPLIVLLGMVIALGGALLLPFWIGHSDQPFVAEPVKTAYGPSGRNVERPQTREVPARKAPEAKQPVSV